LLGIASGGGIALAASYPRYRLTRQFLTFLTPAILVVPLLFVLATPVSSILLPRELRPVIPGVSRGDVPVVFLVLDCLPAAMLVDNRGDIDAIRFPNVARLAQRAHWFRQTRTVARNTEGALAPLLTGRYKGKGTLSLAEHYPENLFTLQRWHGMTVLESVSRLCPKSLQESRGGEPLSARLRSLGRDSAVVYGQVVLPARLSAWLPPIDDQWGDFGVTAELTEPEESWEALRGRVRAAAVQAVRSDSVARFATFLSGLQPDGLSYLHLNLPHSPFLYLPSGKRYVSSRRRYRPPRVVQAFGKVREGKVPLWTTEEYPVRLAYARLALQAAFADRLLGRLLDQMVEMGIFDRALVVLVSDHGESFRPGRRRRDMEDGGTLHVPLLIKQPFQESAVVDDRAATLLDVLPTIRDVLKIEVAWEMDGSSLLGDGDRPTGEDPKGWPEDLLAKDVERSHSWIGYGEVDRIYRIGPFPDLVGVGVGDVSSGSGSPFRLTWSPPDPQLTVQLDFRWRLGEVALDRRFIPAYLTGQLSDGGSPVTAMDLAVELNGRIAATCRSLTDLDGTSRVAVLVPEALLRHGRNEVRILRIRPQGPKALELIPLRDADSQA
jgi:hypothetical protein